MPPLTMPEQENVIQQIRHDNDKANFVYRAGMLVVYTLVVFLYLTPIPSYLLGNHSKSHVTLYLQHHSIIGTEDDLTYLPAFPIYMFIFGFLTYIMFLAGRECASRAGLVKMKGVAFPAQPHPFGTAPGWLVPVLRDLRLQPTKNVKADPTQQSEGQHLAKVLPPQIVYLGFLWVCTWPAPLLTFGAGAFLDAAWWTFPFGALSIHLLIEWWIHKAERETIGLSNLKYNYKGA